MTCHHPATIAEDGTPGPRLWCDVCGQVLIEPPGWAPAEPPRVDWIRRRPWWAKSAGPAETGASMTGKP